MVWSNLAALLYNQQEQKINVRGEQGCCLVLYLVAWWSLSPFFLVCFHLSVCMHGGEKPGVFSVNLLHVHGETACTLHIIVDLYPLWHLCCISDSLQSFITESTCTYSTTALWGGDSLSQTGKCWPCLKSQDWNAQVNLKCSVLPHDPMDHAPRNSSAHVQAEALGATPIARQSPKHCTSALWTASQSARRESARQISQRNVGIS